MNAARRSGWGVAFADLNNDGWKDLFTANSHVTDNVEQVRSERYREPNTVFLNRRGNFVAVQEIGAPAAHRVLLSQTSTMMDASTRWFLFWVTSRKYGVMRRMSANGCSETEGQSIGAKVRVRIAMARAVLGYGICIFESRRAAFRTGRGCSRTEVEIIWPNGKGRLFEMRRPSRLSWCESLPGLEWLTLARSRKSISYQLECCEARSRWS